MSSNIDSSFIKPLIIGGKWFSTNLIQAPLAGVSCAPFRSLVWQFGGVGYCVTEMLSAAQLANDLDRSPRYTKKFPQEGPLCWQLSGNQSTLLARACAKAIALGAALIDLNCGCPKPKIRKKGCGSQLLTQEQQLIKLIRAMRQEAGNTPITLKMRLDGGLGEFCEASLAELLEQAGVDALIVHGRNHQQGYETPCQLEGIARIVERVNIPVISNGDIQDKESLINVFKQTGCAGFMIGRHAVGQPWLFQQLVCEASGRVFTKPSQTEIGELFLKHLEGLATLEGEHLALLQCRKFSKYYARTLKDPVGFVSAFNQLRTYAQAEACVQAYFSDSGSQVSSF